jgi:hypothetical protein
MMAKVRTNIIYNNISQIWSLLNVMLLRTIVTLTEVFFKKGLRDRRGCDRMVVGFTTTYVISAYHHWCSEFESRSGWGIQHYVIKFVGDLRQVGGFLRVLRFPPPIKLIATK